MSNSLLMPNLRVIGTMKNNMQKNKKNEELQSRREFFKKAAKGALPILGAIVLANVPGIMKANESDAMGCSCGVGCAYTCRMSCKGYCHTTCTGNCYRTCSGGCTGSSRR